jgi:hypothetical protein
MQLLLLICDGLEMDKTDLLMIALQTLAGRRNALAHPKTKQVSPDQPAKDRTGRPIPETAQEQIQAMREFFSSSADLFPEVASYSPKGSGRLRTQPEPKRRRDSPVHHQPNLRLVDA